MQQSARKNQQREIVGKVFSFIGIQLEVSGQWTFVHFTFTGPCRDLTPILRKALPYEVVTVLPQLADDGSTKDEAIPGSKISLFVRNLSPLVGNP
jgi:hypothetical protein